MGLLVAIPAAVVSLMLSIGTIQIFNIDSSSTRINGISWNAALRFQVNKSSIEVNTSLKSNAQLGYSQAALWQQDDKAVTAVQMVNSCSG